MVPIAIHTLQLLNRLCRLMFFSLLLALGFGNNQATADTCLSAPKPLVFVVVKGKNGFDAEVADLLEDAIMGRLNQNGIRYTRIKELHTMLQQDVWRQLIGTAQDASLVQEAARQLGTEWLYFIQLQGARIVGTPRTIEARLQNNRTGETLRATSRELSLNEEEMMQTVFQVISEQGVNLHCDLRGSQIKPVVPSLRLTLSKESVLPGETFLSYASLRDLSDNNLQVDKLILFNHEPPPPALSSVGEWPTDANGLASYPWRVDNYSAAKGSVQASFIPRANIVGATSPKRYYRLIRPGGNLLARSGRATLLPNQSDTVQFVLTNNGQPAVGKTLNFSASGGTLATASAVTDAQGQVQVAYTAPAQPAVTEVSVSTAFTAAASSGLRAAAPADPPLQESLNYVVDAGVAMKLNLTDTLIASPASISVDLDRNGTALSGIPVDFQLQGGGSLNATRVNTDSAGRAETLFLAPQDAGASTINVSASVDGQALTRSGSIRYTDARDSITREIQEVIRLMFANPSDTTLQRLLNLKNQLNTLGQASRAEELLGTVSNPLNCVEQLTNNRCASGAGLASVQSTLNLLKSVTGNTGLNYISDRVTETARFCPYPAFMRSYDYPAGQVSYENGTHDFTVSFGISLNENNQPRAFSFGFTKEDDPYKGLFVRSAVFVSGTGTNFTGLIDNGGDTSLPGGRFGMLAYQSAATSPTVHISVDGKNVSGSFDLYKYYDKDNVEHLATASFNATLDFPPAPTDNCGGRTPPINGGD